MSIMDKLKKNSKIKESAVLSKSKYFGKSDQTSTDIPAINIALSGEVDGGLSPGVTIVAGPSKHFKTNFTLKMASAYMDKHPEAVMLFYDSEFGSPQSYFSSFGIDLDRVLHCPIKNIEELKFDLVPQLEGLDKGDKVIIVIDSIGNLASIKEVDDALAGKSAADMTRAKQLKGLFRIITPYLNMNDIPFIGIAHVYDTQEMFSKKVVSGGTGLYYSADDIWIIGRRQVKDKTEVTGYDFIINIEKSRFVREARRIPVSVSWENGIEKHSGLFDMALAGGFITQTKVGWYSMVDQETGEVEEKSFRRAATDNMEFWNPILETGKFRDFIRSAYKMPDLAGGEKFNTNDVEIVSDDEVED